MSSKDLGFGRPIGIKTPFCLFAFGPSILFISYSARERFVCLLAVFLRSTLCLAKTLGLGGRLAQHPFLDGWLSGLQEDVWKGEEG